MQRRCFEPLRIPFPRWQQSWVMIIRCISADCSKNRRDFRRLSFGIRKQYLSNKYKRLSCLTKPWPVPCCKHLISANLKSLCFCFCISHEDCFKYRSYKRLDKKQLWKKCKWKVKTDKFQPVCQQRKNVKACIIRIVKPCRQKAHSRAHQPHSCTYNGGFKVHWMGRFGVKYFACQAEG